jgi:hypothetical protein
MFRNCSTTQQIDTGTTQFARAGASYEIPALN